MSYIESLYETYKEAELSIVNHDNGATPQSMQCYFLVSNLPPKAMKDKGGTARDVGNYIYKRYGFAYEIPPEYHRRGEPKNSLAFYQSKKTFQSNHNEHVRKWILWHDKTKKRPESILYEAHRLTIQHIPPWTDFVAAWKKTGELVILRKGTFQEIIFCAGKREFKYLQAELGPISDFIVLGEL